MKQIAIAFLNHYIDYNIFPSGGGHAQQGRAYVLKGKIDKNPPLGGKLPDRAQIAVASYQEWGWAYQILPYIEHDKTWISPGDDQVRQTVVTIYFCPTRRKPSPNEKNARGLTIAGIDYAGNGGITGPAKKVGWLSKDRYKPPFDDYTATGTVIRSSAWYPEPKQKLAVPGQQRLRDVSLGGGIPDGTSNTVLLAEKRMQLGKVNRNPANDAWGFVEGWGPDTIVRYHPEEQKLQPQQDNADPVPDFALGSAHSHVHMVAMTDGAIRRIRYGASPEMLSAIMIRNDGETIDWKKLE